MRLQNAIMLVRIQPMTRWNSMINNEFKMSERHPFQTYYEIINRNGDYIGIRQKKTGEILKVHLSKISLSESPDSYIKYKLRCSKKKSELYGYPYELTFEKLKQKYPMWPTTCEITGIELHYFALFGCDSHSPNLASLDRTDNEKGYTVENTRIVSWKGNRLKENLSVRDLKMILNYYHKLGITE